MIVGNYFADYCKETDIDIDTKMVQEALTKQDNYLDELLALDGKESIYDIKDEMRNIMQDKVGIFRNGKNIKEAVEELKVLLKKTKDINITNKHRLLNQELEEA